MPSPGHATAARLPAGLHLSAARGAAMDGGRRLLSSDARYRRWWVRRLGRGAANIESAAARGRGDALPCGGGAFASHFHPAVSRPGKSVSTTRPGLPSSKVACGRRCGSRRMDGDGDRKKADPHRPRGRLGAVGRDEPGASHAPAVTPSRAPACLAMFRRPNVPGIEVSTWFRLAALPASVFVR